MRAARQVSAVRASCHAGPQPILASDIRVTRRRAGVDRPPARASVLLRSEPVPTPDVRGTGGGPDRATPPFFTGGTVGDEGGRDGTRRAPGSATVREAAASRPTDCAVGATGSPAGAGP